MHNREKQGMGVLWFIQNSYHQLSNEIYDYRTCTYQSLTLPFLLKFETQHTNMSNNTYKHNNSFPQWRENVWYAEGAYRNSYPRNKGKPNVR